MQGIVHLAAMSKESSTDRLVPDNAVALANLLRSATEAGVTHVVFASSMHVMGMYRRDERFAESDAPRPDSHYAATKLHGEALCRLYHEKYGLDRHLPAARECDGPGGGLRPGSLDQP